MQQEAKEGRSQSIPLKQLFSLFISEVYYFLAQVSLPMGMEQVVAG
jgi:hypothetical protein